jgi:hypothetical protein
VWGDAVLAGELLHLPDKPAGVEETVWGDAVLAIELLHLPGKPVGVEDGGPAMFGGGSAAPCNPW